MMTLTTILTHIVIAADETEFDETAVTPGVLGFVVTAVFALAVILLGADLVRRVRRNQYRAEIQQELEAELAERQAREDADGENVDSPGTEADDPYADDAGRRAGDADN